MAETISSGLSINSTLISLQIGSRFSSFQGLFKGPQGAMEGVDGSRYFFSYFLDFVLGFERQEKDEGEQDPIYA